MPNLSPYLLLSSSRFVPTATPGGTVRLDNVESMTVTQGSYGSIGTATLSTTISGNSGLASNIGTAARRGPVSAQVMGTVTSDPTGLKTWAVTPLFTGNYDDGDYALESNQFEMHFRDLGSVLMERTVQPAQSFPNLTIAGYIEQLILQAGFQQGQIVYIDPCEDQAGNPLLTGSFFDSQHTLAITKQSVWGIIQKLAKLTGNVCFFTALGEFYFGPRSTEQTLGRVRRTLNFSLNGPSDLKHIAIKHQPYKHAAFVAQVASHNRNTGLVTQSAVEYLNNDVATDLYGSGGLGGLRTGKTVPQFLSGLNGIPTYGIFVEGKQQNEIQRQALSQAREIQSQEIVVKGTLIGTAQIDVGDPLAFAGTSLPFVDGFPFTATSVTYKFDINGDGLLCDFVAWQEDAQVVP
jgi:hypothetical protein